MHCFVKEHQPGLPPALFKALPVKVLKHFGNTGGWVIRIAFVIVIDKAGRSPLDHLYFVAEVLRVWVPDCATILHQRSCDGLVGKGFCTRRCMAEVAPKHPKCTVCLCCDPTDVIVPSEFVVYI